MATQTVTLTDNGFQGAQFTAALGNADNSQVFRSPPCQQATFVVQGTFGSATVVVQASYDGGTTWYTLKDSNNTAMSYTSAPTNPIPFVPPGGTALRVSSSGGTGTALNWYLAYSKAFI